MPNIVIHGVVLRLITIVNSEQVIQIQLVFLARKFNDLFL
jgi:hypothetical protein